MPYWVVALGFKNCNVVPHFNTRNGTESSTKVSFRILVTSNYPCVNKRTSDLKEIKRAVCHGEHNA